MFAVARTHDPPSQCLEFEPAVSLVMAMTAGCLFLSVLLIEHFFFGGLTRTCTDSHSRSDDNKINYLLFGPVAVSLVQDISLIRMRCHCGRRIDGCDSAWSFWAHLMIMEVPRGCWCSLNVGSDVGLTLVVSKKCLATPHVGQIISGGDYLEPDTFWLVQYCCHEQSSWPEFKQGQAWGRQSSISWDVWKTTCSSNPMRILRDNGSGMSW